ncbi:MAG: DsbA family protein [Parcubacteria group bacterium]|nr:DsbA family protein [Parcubacteria group bacterium]
MQNFNAEEKPKRTVRNATLALLGAGMLVYAVFFAIQVFSIRSQILSGTYDPSGILGTSFDAYGARTSGAGGANVDQRGAYDVATFDDPSLGPANAKVTIVEFGDFECPFCKQSFPIIRTLAQEFKDDVRLVYRDFPLETIHPKARFAAAAGYCAEEQGLFWALHDKLFQNQEDLSQAAIMGYANQIGADSAAFAACVSSQAAQDEVNKDIADGQAAGVLGTPTWFINGIRVAGVIPEDVFRQIIIELAK